MAKSTRGFKAALTSRGRAAAAAPRLNSTALPATGCTQSISPLTQGSTELRPAHLRHPDFPPCLFLNEVFHLTALPPSPATGQTKHQRFPRRSARGGTPCLLAGAGSEQKQRFWKAEGKRKQAEGRGSDRFQTWRFQGLQEKDKGCLSLWPGP